MHKILDTKKFRVGYKLVNAPNVWCLWGVIHFTLFFYCAIEITIQLIYNWVKYWLTFHQVMIAGGLDPLHLQLMLYLLPALSSSCSLMRLTSKGLRYISMATLTTRGGCNLLLLTSQLYTANRWLLVNFSTFNKLCDFFLSGKYWHSSVTSFPSLHHDTWKTGSSLRSDWIW